MTFLILIKNRGVELTTQRPMRTNGRCGYLLRTGIGTPVVAVFRLLVGGRGVRAVIVVVRFVRRRIFGIVRHSTILLLNETQAQYPCLSALTLPVFSRNVNPSNAAFSKFKNRKRPAFVGLFLEIEGCVITLFRSAYFQKSFQVFDLTISYWRYCCRN